MNENEVLTSESERIRSFFRALERMLDVFEQLMVECKPTLGGDRFLTDKEVSEKLKVSRRTLQDYRTEGMISYIQLGGKILYRESDIEKMLEDGYRKSFE